jgi:antitoxin (DNA-binding transcriptional repressor) of toxin-antitoxin stability system
MVKIPVRVAAADLPRLVERAIAGEEIVLSEGAGADVRLVPVAPRRARRTPGSMKGRFVVGDAFFEALSEADLSAS